MRAEEKGAGDWGLGAGVELRSAGPVTHFRDLVVWQRGMDVVEAVYRASGAFPKSELYGLSVQIRRVGGFRSFEHCGRSHPRL